MKQRTLLVPSAVVAASFALPALAQGYGDHPHYWGSGWGMMIFGPVMMIGFIAALVVVVVLLVRWIGGSHGHAPGALHGRSAPLDILKERFARGEIDKDEFEERKRLLSE